MTADGEKAELNQYKTALERRRCAKEAGTQRAGLPSAVNVKPVSIQWPLITADDRIHEPITQQWWLGNATQKVRCVLKTA